MNHRPSIALGVIALLAGCAMSSTPDAALDGRAPEDAGTDAFAPDASVEDAPNDAGLAPLDAPDALADQGMDAGPPCLPEPEICNGRDDDCDGMSDEEPEASTWCGARCGVETCPRARAWAPASGGLVTSRRPTFRWFLEGGADAARVEVCLDRACRDVVLRLDGVTDARPAVELPRGVVFWRLVPRRAGADLQAVSPAWPLFVPNVTHSDRDTTIEQWFDFNCDGYVDRIAKRYDRTTRRGWEAVLVGGPGGFTELARIGEYTNPASPTESLLEAIGDIDGDGCSDVRWAGGGYHIGFGSPSGITPGPVLMSRNARETATAGDVDGDGYADVLVLDQTPQDGGSLRTYRILRGGPRDRAGREWLDVPTTGPSQPLFRVGTAGDLDGDGRMDLLIRHATQLWRVLGGDVLAAPASFAPGPQWFLNYEPAIRGLGDLDGDGVPDFGDFESSPRLASGYFARIARSRDFSPTATNDIWARVDPVFDALLADRSCDIDGDGYGDVVFAQFSAPIFQRGGPTGPVESIPFPALPGLALREANDVVCLGDHDRDGYQDLSIGAEGGTIFTLRGTARGFDPVPIAQFATTQ